ncbi:MAG TPA: hypothetical protein VFB79_16275, partial [Candidatus Angelobacter sp.]|nr:hypothetical protein [Candidatus Angelobacter sp.]
AKNNLQDDIFRALLPISQSDVEEQLVRAEPGARKHAADSIIARYVEKKQPNTGALRSTSVTVEAKLALTKLYAGKSNSAQI